MKLLLIEDSRDISLALSRALYADYDVDLASTGQNGLNKALTGNYGLIILDLNLPDIYGLEICQQLRKQNIKAPILILSGDIRVLSKISLLDSGADDYLTKPFSLGELKVRLRTIARRSDRSELKRNHIKIDDLELDSIEHSVHRAGQNIGLRRKEFALLECLMQNVGEVVSRDMLCSHAWSDTEDPWNNTVDVHIKYLRDKVDRPFANQMIKTVHGIGYKLELRSVDNDRQY